MTVAEQVWLDFLIQVRIRCDAAERLLDLVEKTCAETDLLFFVGSKCVEDIRFCLGGDDERSAHSAMLSQISATS
jgi:hypothetical protein